MSYSTKNYTEQGGEKTVIGGTLEIKDGASVKGLPPIENQAVSNAATVAALKDNFNSLLVKLKDAGYMTLDEWNVSVSKIPNPNGEELVVNHGKVSDISIEDGIITVVVDVDELVAFPRSNPEQGTHKWIGMEITTGLQDITAIKYNGTQLTSADVDEAASVGCPAGDIVIWLKCNEIVEKPKVFTLCASGYGEKSFTVSIEAPEQS